MNPCQKKSSSLTFFHWNLNGIAAHDFAKIDLIQCYALSNDNDIIFLSETFLDSSTEASDLNINFSGYIRLRSDHPLNTKGENMCMFYKDNLTVIRRDSLCALTECIVTEIQLRKKSMFFY